MIKFSSFLLLFTVLTVCTAAPTPVVLWHGMGDTATSLLSMQPLIDLIKLHVPGIYVRSIRIGSSTLEDEFGGFFGNFNDQLAKVCQQLAEDTQLSRGFNAVGLSQGGQFLRAYVQRCNSPPILNLVSLGGQHMGVAEIPHCELTNSSFCEAMAKLLTKGAYADGVRNISIQAQYFRSPYNYSLYLEKNIFLADINNERSTKNPKYKTNLQSLKNLVLVKFTEDTMVIPRESEWFGAFKDGGEAFVVPIEQQAIYTEDWIGLKELNATGRLNLTSCPGDHLQFSKNWFIDSVIKPYLS